MKNLRLSLIALAAASLVPACSLGPVATEHAVWMGGSAGTKTKGHYARYSGPLGTIQTGNVESDETLIPRAAITAQNVVAGLNATTSMFRAGESTKRVVSGHSLQKASIKSAENIEKARLAVPAELPAAIVPTP